MIKKNIITFYIICTSVISSNLALANTESEIPKSYGYVQINGGPTFIKSGAGILGNKSEGQGSIYGVEAGYKFDDYTRASISLDYMPNHSFTAQANENTSGTFSGENYVISSNNNFKVNSWVAMLNGYYDIKNTSSFTPYVTLGLGLARNKAKSTYTNASSINGQVLNTANTSLGYMSKDNFAYKAGFGVKYAISNKFDFDLRYQFVDLGKFSTSTGKLMVEGVNQTVQSQTIKLKAQEVLFGIAYKF